MLNGSRRIDKYIIGAITPYLLLSLLLLTAILFTQQISRFGEMLLGTRVPLGTVAEVALAVLPNVLVFTLPMALLTGVLIGFSRMGSDSELTALRAAGVGTWNLLRPALILGLLLTLASLYANLYLVPDSARLLRRAGVRAALYKLESPVEPQSFNTDLPGYVIYIRDGDKSQGIWEKVFLYTEMKDGSIQLVNARSGRIDSSGEQSELVLTDADLTTIPKTRGEGNGAAYVTEHLEQWRIVLDVGRKAILERLQKEELESKPSEMGWRALSDYAEKNTGIEGREARILLHKRLAMSLTPAIFSFLGAALGLRVRKGGRGAGAFLSLASMLSYYLITLAGEQLARAGNIPEYFGVWMASIITLLCAVALLLTGRLKIFDRMRTLFKKSQVKTSSNPLRQTKRQPGSRVRLLSFPSLMDLNVLRTTALNFALSLLTLTAIFLIFTLFELWRFIAMRGIGLRLVAEYLLFLLPMVIVQLLPSSVLIAVIATYALLSRHSEATAWWASGQSVYRLMLPGLIFAVFVATGLWIIQEQIMPESNIRQDALRSQIREGASRTTVGLNRQWLASSQTRRIYSYEYQEPETLRNPLIFELTEDGIHLERIIRGQSAHWAGDDFEVNYAESISFVTERVRLLESTRLKIEGADPADMFRPTQDKPAHLSAKSLSNYLKSTGKREDTMSDLSTALYKKYATPFSVLVIALTGIPLALSFGRKSAIIALCLAITLGLLFWAAAGVFQQLGEHSLLPPAIAAWAPLLIFSTIGLYLLTRSRT